MQGEVRPRIGTKTESVYRQALSETRLVAVSDSRWELGTA